MAIVKVHYDAGREWENIRLPGSKSIAARALVCRYVYGLDTELVNLPDCDDTIELSEALRRLSEKIDKPLLRLEKFGELPPCVMEFNLGNGGTSLRFFTALAASLPGLTAYVDCAPGLKRRPLAPLLDELTRHGAEIECLERPGYAPLKLTGHRLNGNVLSVSSGQSSQFLSALLMASPLWDIDEAPVLPDVSVSRPYVEMTRKVMESFAKSPKCYEIEADWSAASYFYELTLAVPGRKLHIENLTDAEHSIQGDSKAQQIFAFLGVKTSRVDDSANEVVLEGDARAIQALADTGMKVRLDMGDTPDLVPALAVGMCLAGIPFALENVGALRVKESDRLQALCTELHKAGFAVHVDDSVAEGDAPLPWEKPTVSLMWNGQKYPIADDETFEGWNDHRIAMAISILALRLGWLGIRDGEVVAKSFPDFYNELSRVGFNIRGLR